MLKRSSVFAVIAVFAVSATHAAEPTSYKLASDWQFRELAGTEFQTHRLAENGGHFFIVRRLMRGELFESIVGKYCAAAKIGDEECKKVAELAEELHKREHWHKNWHVHDAVYLLIPEAAYAPRRTARD